MIKPLRALRFIPVLACLCMSFNGLAAQAVYDFTISSASADEALTEFARQADTTLLFDYELVEKFETNSLSGQFTLKEGLQKLLAGTELAIHVDATGTFSVRHVSELPATPSPSENNAEPQDNQLTFGLERIAIVGTRSSPRTVTSSSVPLDIITDDAFRAQSGANLLDMLAASVPSLNVNDQPINDATSLVRPANLRGMASDHTLLLLNGKRRHRSAVITFLGGGLSDGAQGPDISVLPASAMKQVEVLRDGAAAQYGSDAIAGVINFVLRDDSDGGSLSVKSGQYFESDGLLMQLQGNVGLPLFDAGFANLTAEYTQQKPTSRTVQRSDASALIDAGNTFVPEPAQVWGTLDVEHDIKLAGNFGYPVGQNKQLYAFMNLAQRQIEGGFYYRHPHLRDGVFSREYQNERVLLIADLDGLDQGIACPQVVINSQNVLTQPDYQIIADEQTAVGRNCFAFNERYPGGFTPRFGGTINDASAFIGMKGETASNWLFDISAGVGYSKIDYTLADTINPSLGPGSPTAFSPGAVAQVERTVNLDISKVFEPGWQHFGPLNLGMGVEWRRETYHQQAGDDKSWQAGPFAFNPQSGLSQGFSVGSNGFPGYQPAAAGHWSRHNWALYLDAETALGAVETGVAVRVERFSDFGSTFDGKLTFRLPVTEQLALRSSVSTGFKAPTVGQSNVINVTTAYAAQGLEDQATLPPTHPISLQLGADALSPEESVNYSFGGVAFFDDNLYLTVDYFNIDLRNRISTTSAIELTQQDIDALLAIGQDDALNYAAAKYFTNDFDTQTQGIDVVLHYQLKTGAFMHDMNLAYNWTDTQVERVSLYPVTDEAGEPRLEANLTPSRIRMLEDNLPSHRGTLTVKHHWNNFTGLWRANYYGSFYEDHLDAAAGFDIYSGPVTTFDAEVAWLLTESTTLSVGAENVFDTRPELNPYRGEVGSEYPPTSPSGINGGFYYANVSVTF